MYFYSVINRHSFSLSDKEINILAPVFVVFKEKTGLEINEYKDIKLIPQNLTLISDILSDYKKKVKMKSDIEILNSFDMNLQKMILEGNQIWITGD